MYKHLKYAAFALALCLTTHAYAGQDISIYYEMTTADLKEKAGQDDAYAQYILAGRYRYPDEYQGEKTRKDLPAAEALYHDAKKYFEYLATQGDPTALNFLAHMYDFGHGVEASQEKAIEYFKQAAELGDSFAVERLIHIQNTGQSPDLCDWLQSNADMGTAGCNQKSATR